MRKKLPGMIVLLLFCANAVSQPCLPEGITFSTQEQIDAFQINYPNCTEIEGGVLIEGNDITNLEGLSVLEAVDGFFWVCNNPVLASLAGLESLTSVGGEFWIQNNEQLIDITSLSSLNIVGENLGVIYNNSLCCLSGLDNILPQSIYNLIIHNNPFLTTCAIESICDYLTNPAGSVDIHDNATGCNSIQEVEEICNVIPIAAQTLLNIDYSISPNPCNEKLIFKILNNEYRILNIELIDLTGTMVKSITIEKIEPTDDKIEIQLDDLPGGIYFCAIETRFGKQIQKIIKL